jgi:hypothetical protein
VGIGSEDVESAWPAAETRAVRHGIAGDGAWIQRRFGRAVDGGVGGTGARLNISSGAALDGGIARRWKMWRSASGTHAVRSWQRRRRSVAMQGRERGKRAAAGR